MERAAFGVEIPKNIKTAMRESTRAGEGQQQKQQVSQLPQQVPQAQKQQKQKKQRSTKPVENIFLSQSPPSNANSSRKGPLASGDRVIRPVSASTSASASAPPLKPTSEASSFRGPRPKKKEQKHSQELSGRSSPSSPPSFSHTTATATSSANANATDSKPKPIPNQNQHAHRHRTRGNRKTDRSGLKGSSHSNGLKKGGGGGSFTWGRPGDEYEYQIITALDEHDPNYDADDGQYVEEDDIMFMSPTDVQSGFLHSPDLGPLVNGARPFHQARPFEPHHPKPAMSLSKFKSTVVDALAEFFVSEDVSDFTVTLESTNSPVWYYEAVRQAVTLAMERRERECELISQLLSHLYGSGITSSTDVAKGFMRLFEVVDDLVLDIPHAKELIARFLARAVADEVLPPAFLMNEQVATMGGEIVDHAKVFLSAKHGVVRMERVWGSGDLASVPELKRKIKALLYEYLSSSDLDEADKCIKQLHVPHFHHELVKRAVVVAMDYGDRERAMMSTLFAELHSRETLSTQQIQAGFRRLVGTLPDLKLDIPRAEEILRVFIAQAVEDGCMSENFARSLL